MSENTFEQFAQALAGQATARSAAATPLGCAANATGFNRMTVLGGGTDAQLLAALGLAAGAQVTLFSAYGAELDALRSAGAITLRGEGPIGSFQIDQPAVPCITTTAELDRAVQDAELIVLTGPVHKQRTYAMVLADHLADGQTLLIAPARTFGALEVSWHLQMGGCRANVSVVELLNLPYAIASAASTLNLSAVAAPGVAVVNGEVSQLQYLSNLLGVALNQAQSSVYNAFADGSGLIEVPALLLGGPGCPNGQPQIADGGVPLADNNTFRNLIGPQHLAVIEALAQERREVAAKFAVRGLPETAQWLQAYAGEAIGEGARVIPDSTHAQHSLRCAVTGSLVPLVSAAACAAVATPMTNAMIDLASSALGSDLRSAGRKLNGLGIDCSSLEVTRRALQQALMGGAHHGR